MHLQRIQVPDFRVLKDVDLVFENDSSPRIFPLGSQNGGGKSTLLQLIFVLLHCAHASERLIALKNTLKDFQLKGATRKALATISILHENKEVELEFFGCTDSYVEQLITEKTVSKEHENEDTIGGSLRFSMIPKLENVREEVSRLANERTGLEALISELEDINNLDEAEKKFRLDRILRQARELINRNRYLSRERTAVSIRTLQEEATEKLDRVKDSYAELDTESVILTISTDRMTSSLKLRNFVYICNYSPYADSSEESALVCQVKNLETGEIDLFLDNLSNKVFLAAPSTQVFLFLSRETNKLLFKEQNNKLPDDHYYSKLIEAKSGIPGLFTYDFFAVDFLIKAFKDARDKDFKEAIETGEYGNAYKVLLNDLNSLLANKQVNLNSNLSEIAFRPLINDGNVEFYPEDLSHGELKRLSIYVWLKYLNVEDAIVLMDEIEIALHPDWQYRIVSDLLQWASTNQYILATHSYELCEALTPANVRELEPRLSRRQLEQSA